MRYILKEISHFDFFEMLEKYYAEIINQLEKDEIDAPLFKTDTNKLISNTKEFIGKCISPNSEEIIQLFDTSYNDIFDNDYSAYGFEKEPEVKKEVERLDRFRKSFRIIIGYLSMTETILNSETELRITSVSDKTDFLLSKLNSVFGDEMYSIEKIFILNNIKLRDNETREIAEDLSKRGYIILKDQYIGSDKVKLSVKGARYIERKHKIDKTSKNKNELDQKIDTILEQLIKLGYGQEIIFNEIDELRALQHKLSKKSWSQLLKGKLVDLALDKLITVDIAKSVYEYLTSNNFKLLK